MDAGFFCRECGEVAFHGCLQCGDGAVSRFAFHQIQEGEQQTSVAAAMTGEISFRFSEVNEFRFFPEFADADHVAVHVAPQVPSCSHDLDGAAADAGEGAHHQGQAGAVFHLQVDDLIVDDIVVTCKGTASVRTIFDGFPDGLFRRFFSQHIDRPFNITAEDPGFRIGELNLFRVIRTAVFGEASIQTSFCCTFWGIFRFEIAQ